jgi:hypothetical protein
MCARLCSWVRFESLFSLCGPKHPCRFCPITFELIGHPEQRAEDGGAIIADQVDEPGFDHETAEFDEVPRALATLDLPCAHIIPRPAA